MNAPITYRAFDPETDYEMLLSWWRGHKSLPWPKAVLPRGLIASGSGVDIAASFIYLTPDMMAVVELTTTNPKVAFSRDSLAAVKGLFEMLEAEARAAGCKAIISFTRPNGSEEHILKKMGYVISLDDPGHRMSAKPLVNEEKFHPPEDGIIRCP